MEDIFQIVQGIVVDVCEMDPSEIQPNSHILNDLEIDSLDIVDIVYELEKSLSVEIPILEWVSETDSGDDKESILYLNNLISRIEALRASAA